MLQTIKKVGLRYIDRAVSAKTDNRPQFQQIIEERLAKPKMKEEFVRFNRKGRFGILF